MADNYDRTAILESFLDEVNAYVPDIRADLDRLQQAPGDTRALEESFRRTHTIAGSAAMMGFQALAHVASGMEETLGEALGHQRPLDAPTVALLRRSLGRLERLIGGVRSNTDGASIATEDDADRAAWRGPGSSGGSRSADLGAAPATGPNRAGMAGMGAPADGHPASRVGPASTPIQIPSWLAAFTSGSDGSGPRNGQMAAATGLPGDIASMPNSSPSSPQHSGPSGVLGPGAGWGMPPAGGAAQAPYPMGPNGSQPHGMPGQNGWANSAADLPTGHAPSPASGSPFSNAPAAWQSSSANIFDATTVDMATMGTEALPTVPHAGPSGAPLLTPSNPNASFGGAALNPAAWGTTAGVPGDVATQHTSPVAAMPAGAPQPAPRAGQPPASNGDGEAALDELRADTLAVQAQVDTLREVIQKLQAAMQEAETERGELRGFLDSSTDAIDRLEAWVRQQAGITLPPEQMRDYLPLAVVYVVTTRLMNLSTMLRESGRDLQVSEEQIDETLGELRRAIEQSGYLYRAVSQVGGTPDQGFQATVAQFAWGPPQTPVATPPAVESLSPAARAEMERQARDELRRALEEEVRAEVALEVRRDESQRLRHELEIDVRRDLLKEIMPGAGDSLSNIQSLAETMARVPTAPGSPRRVQITSEQSPEALEVFRDEAMDHLREITEGITQLEVSQNSHDDLATLQRIRRAMHTLKGAAGMMGFTTIQEVAHASEDVLDRMSEGTTSFNPAVLSLLLETSEALDQMISGRLANPDEQQRVSRDLIARYGTFGGTVSPAVVDRPIDAPEATYGRAMADDELDEAHGMAATSPDLSVRLQVRELDHLISLFGELVSTRAVLEERMGRLGQLVGDTVNVSDRLQGVGSQLETQFEAAALPSGGPSAGLPGMGMPAYGGYPGGPGGYPGMPAMPPGMAPGGPFPPGAAFPPAGYPGGPGYAPRSGGLPRQGGQRAGHVGEFDELELDRYTEFHRVSRGLMEGIADASTLSHEMELLTREISTAIERESRLSAEFQARLLKAGLVKIQTLAPRLLRAARTTATKAGKEIEFFVEGGDTEVERRVIEAIEGPLLHLVRNAVVHGIETPDERARLGKPRAGRITLVARYESNQVAITVADDGAGIDPQRVHAAAVEHGWADESALSSSRDAMELIFHPGVTTATAITEESGRGVGLDVVRDVATRLRGTAEVDSRVGQGSIFTLKLPINLQIARAVLVRVEKQVVAIPMLSVGEIARLEYFPRVPGDERAVDVRGEPYMLVHLASYLNPSARPKIDSRTPVLLIATGRQRIALLIDEIQSQKEIVAKPLGPHLRDVRGIAGATVLGNGQVVLILDVQELLSTPPRGEVPIPATLATSQSEDNEASAHPTEPFSQVAETAWNQTTARSQAAVGALPTTDAARGFVVTPRDAFAADGGSATAGQGSYLLVVDDSPTVRRVVGGMLKSHGWRVETARDGMEALDVIGRERPAAVLLDIEMPRMDGYELMATVRSQDAYKTLPLIVLTSRAAAKHRQRAVQLGASAYIVKPYQEDDLLTTISRLVQAQG